jgi:hypothetical protein
MLFMLLGGKSKFKYLAQGHCSEPTLTITPMSHPCTMLKGL